DGRTDGGRDARRAVRTVAAARSRADRSARDAPPGGRPAAQRQAERARDERVDAAVPGRSGGARDLSRGGRRSRSGGAQCSALGERADRGARRRPAGCAWSRLVSPSAFQVPEAYTGERLAAEDPRFAPDMARHLAAYELVAPLVAGLRVLEAGCGEGYGAALLARRAAH